MFIKPKKGERVGRNDLWRMAEYYFENRKDRTLKAYLKIGESKESSFLLTFKRTDAEPRSVVKGSNKADEKLIYELERIAKMKYSQIVQDTNTEWIPIPVTDDESLKDDEPYVYDPSIIFLVKEYKRALNLL